MARKAVLVEWVDSISVRGGVWKEGDDVRGLSPEPIVSLGFIIKETGAYLTLAAHEGGGQISGDLCIPKCAIKRRSPVKLPERKKRARR